MTEREQIQTDLMTLISALLQASETGEWRGTCLEISQKYNDGKKRYETLSPEQVGKIIFHSEEPLMEIGIVHRFRPSGGRRFHCFYRR